MALYWLWEVEAVDRWVTKILLSNEKCTQMSIIILKMNITFHRSITLKWISYKRLWYIFNLGFVYHYLSNWSAFWCVIVFETIMLYPKKIYFIYIIILKILFLIFYTITYNYYKIYVQYICIYVQYI